MLCPEVWNFDPPPSSSSTRNCESEEDIFEQSKHLYFNHFVSVTLPNTIQLPNDVINAFLEDSQYYRINKLSAAELVKKDFISFFIKRGQLTAISICEFSEENSFVITPCGKFILSLTKSTFQELGIEATFKNHSKSSLRKYLIVLDLISESSKLKKLEKLEKKLAFCKKLQFDVVLAWEPEDFKICPSSIAYYFSKRGYVVNVCDILYNHKVKYNVEVPILDEESDLVDFIEWLAAFSLGCDISNDNQLSSMRCPQENEVLGQVMQLTFSGLISNKRLKKVVSEINKYVTAKCPSTWISLTVQGFQDSIISVRNKTLFLSESDQHFAIIFRINHPCVVYNFHEKRS